jgi:hypothetical protein
MKIEQAKRSCSKISKPTYSAALGNSYMYPWNSQMPTGKEDEWG